MRSIPDPPVVFGLSRTGSHEAMNMMRSHHDDPALMPKLRILLAHNRYVYRGGEDSVFDQERDLLRKNGQEVVEFTKSNSDIEGMGRLRLALGTVWARESYREISSLITRTRPDVVHVHNTVPLISPAIYYAAARHGVPVVQTLHNYRLICLNGLFQREGRVCELCIGKSIAWPAVRHACYREDRAATTALAASMAVHRAAGTWRDKVSRFIALSQFSRDKILAAGLDPERVVVKPNFARDAHGAAAYGGPRSGALFVGRLSQEKGIDVLLAAWRELAVSLTVIGDGPLAHLFRDDPLPFVDTQGFVASEVLPMRMRTAEFMVMPSLVYEGFPMIVAEAFSAGVPIIASRLGALGELVEDGVTGLHFEAGNASALAEKVRWAASHPEEMRKMGRNARAVYEAKYTPERNYRELMRIYQSARTRMGRAGVSA